MSESAVRPSTALTLPTARIGGMTVCVVLLLALAWNAAAQPHGTLRLAESVPIGASLGAVLLLTEFGFAGAFRRVVTHGDVSAFRAHTVMLGVASALMIPMLSLGHVFGHALHGEATPIGVAFILGALLFGAGMQWGGGCASGTLFALGGGNARLLGTLLGFVVGSGIGAWSMGWFWTLPALPGVTVQALFGTWGGLAIQLAVLLAAFVAMRGSAIPRRLLIGGIALAVLNAATLVVIGKPWGETSAFALWGSKWAGALGFSPESWAYWLRPGFTGKLAAPVTLDVTSLMDASIVLGAVLAALASRRFDWRSRFSPRAWAMALLGGIAMGFGARLANGCNIGAYFSAISVGNVSGWVWMAAALAGSWIGVRLRGN
ncbi:YeeE/YedE family protein [Tanticharoenia sakaeratensis]|uniref:YeeE/YedE family protein n=1 Tax=Tanticharoenia sakaeratensis NBRC 103193 TaxID=1231623 RepID=A0A0D6MQR4_9PROT|nr:YeeE/YedE family protein [Tanticharoenia sakaeratensis]GAN55776.1 YeeE/YedE family protein [Tanticharoenia sakaeratensis NBRC 103193]GBQ18609.1 hypothetical protein AA103193_0747 [Tanticharoenia sakaeratensis NBRC 103193]